MSGVVLVSILAAFLFGLSAVWQQKAASEQSAGDRERIGGLTLMRRLLRSRTWVAGQITDLFGFFSQAGALRLGSVGVVQPLITTDLLFAIGLDAVVKRRRLRLAEVVGGAAVCAGLAIFLSVKAAVPADGLPDRGRMFEAAPLVAAAVIVVLLATRRLPPLPSCVLLGIGAGLFFASSAVLIKLTTHDLFDRGVAATATDWPGYTLAVSTTSGLVLEQLSFAAGPLAAGMTAMTITNPLVSYVFAVFCFHTAPPQNPEALAAVAGAGALLTFGVMLLSRSTARIRAKQAASSAASGGSPANQPTTAAGV